MEGGGRSSTARLLLLALTIAASSATAAAAVAQRRQPSADSGSYELITIQTIRRDNFKLAVRAHDSSIAGFANNKNDWFAIHGSEDLLEPLRNKYGDGVDIPSHGLVTLLGAMLKKKNATT